MTTTEGIEIVKILGALIAFALGLSQYRVAQSWKRMEFTAAEVGKFRADPMVKRVFLMLDWSARHLDLGLKAQDAGEPPPLVTYALVTSALTPHTDRGPFTPLEAAIRDHFDAFLDHLCHFEAFVAAGLIREQDLRPYLQYWTNALTGGDKIPEALLDQFWRFVDSYGYDSARVLMTRLHPEAPRIRGRK